jgi:NAD(P)-dependent dehydrogenase (short-subunit alcohol dehydrogenase family)
MKEPTQQQLSKCTIAWCPGLPTTTRMRLVRPLNEQIIVVTGATAGLGRHLVGKLAVGGATVVIHGRDEAKVDKIRAEVSATSSQATVLTVVADLADLRQVERMASELLDRTDRLDVLVNNAGIGFGPPRAGREVSADGYELRFAVNYLAGYHLTRRLLPRLVASAPARIVNVVSIGQQPLDFADLMLEGAYTGVAAYRRSKLAQIMFTFDLAEELAGHGVTVNALHPATFMDTAMVRDAGGRPMSTVEEGATATLRLITAPELDGVTGRFFDGLDEARANDQAYDAEARAHLRHVSDQLVRRAG